MSVINTDLYTWKQQQQPLNRFFFKFYNVWIVFLKDLVNAAIAFLKTQNAEIPFR